MVRSVGLKGNCRLQGPIHVWGCLSAGSLPDDLLVGLLINKFKPGGNLNKTIEWIIGELSRTSSYTYTHTQTDRIKILISITVIIDNNLYTSSLLVDIFNNKLILKSFWLLHS